MSKLYLAKSEKDDFYGELDKIIAQLEKIDIGKQNKIIHYSVWETNLKDLAGKILTIIDASIPEGKQNKCVKDLVKKEFRDFIWDIQKFYSNGSWGHSINLD